MTQTHPYKTSKVTAAVASYTAYGGYIKHKRRVIVIMALITFVLAMISMGLGAYTLSPAQIVQGMFNASPDPTVDAIIQNIRLPRVLSAIVSGIALALAGCTYQATLRNPLASASTLGISQGAAFGASIAIILFVDSTATSAVTTVGSSTANPYLTGICAFIGAILSTVIILGLSSLRDMSSESIVLLGVALSAVFTAGTTLIQYFASDDQVATVIFWTFGDLTRVSTQQLRLLSIITAAGAIFIFCNRWNYNALETGDTLAYGLGISVKGVRLSNTIIASLLASSVIACAGIINFVGLIAPHIMRRILGADYRYLLPASALCGSCVLIVADMLCNLLIPPTILPVSAITSLIGAPIFIYLLFKGVRH